MQYVTIKRFKRNGQDGYDHNIPYGTAVEERDGTIYSGVHPVCAERSFAGHSHFARDDDRQGLRRGALTAAIIEALAVPDKQHQVRWDKVWEDPRCQPYRRADQPDEVWLWNEDFFRLDIDTLEYIADLVGAKKGA